VDFDQLLPRLACRPSGASVQATAASRTGGIGGIRFAAAGAAMPVACGLAPGLALWGASALLH
jgi:hypothetical protein